MKLLNLKGLGFGNANGDIGVFLKLAARFTRKTDNLNTKCLRYLNRAKNVLGITRCADAYKNIVFILGGSLGFHENALKRADFVLSLSDMTFTHSMARVILLEQIYRGYKIINKEPYHK